MKNLELEVMEKQQQVLAQLVAGNQRFMDGHSHLTPELSLSKLKEFALVGQNPNAIVLCCSDSRAPVEIIFDQDIGDLFVIRVAGNIVAPSLVGSVEFAATTYNTSVAIVMGHSHCGAVTSTIRQIERVERVESDNIGDIVSRIRPHIYLIAKRNDLTFPEKLQQAIEANVQASVVQLIHSSRTIEDLVDQGRLKILGAILDLHTGKVNFLDFGQ